MKHPNIALTTDGGAKEVKRKTKLVPKTQKDLSKNYDLERIEIYENKNQED